jgi:hypothetical protein
MDTQQLRAANDELRTRTQAWPGTPRGHDGFLYSWKPTRNSPLHYVFRDATFTDPDEAGKYMDALLKRHAAKDATSCGCAPKKKGKAAPEPDDDDPPVTAKPVVKKVRRPLARRVTVPDPATATAATPPVLQRRRVTK